MAGLCSHYHVKGSFRVSLCSLYPGLLGAAHPRAPLPARKVPPGFEGSQVPGPGAGEALGQAPQSQCPRARGGHVPGTAGTAGWACQGLLQLSTPGATGQHSPGNGPVPGHPYQGTRSCPLAQWDLAKAHGGSRGVGPSQGLMKDVFKRLLTRNCTSQACVGSHSACTGSPPPSHPVPAVPEPARGTRTR